MGLPNFFLSEIRSAALFRKSSDNFTNNVWISSSIMDSLDINIFDRNWHCSRPQCQRSSERRIWPWNFKPIVSMSCNTVFTLQHPKKIPFDLKRREVPNLAAGWCDGDGSQAENYFESVDLNFKSGTAGWTHTKVYIMWFYVVVMGQTQKILLGFGFNSKLNSNSVCTRMWIPTFGFDSFLKRNVFLLCFQCWNFCFGKEMDLDKEVQLQLITTKL